MQIAPLQRHGSGSLGSTARGLRPPAAHPRRARGSPARTARSRQRPGPCGAEPGTSDCSPFFRRQKFQLTSLEAGLGRAPKAALGSQVLTHRSQLTRWRGRQQGSRNARSGCGRVWRPGPALLLQPVPSPAGLYVLQ